MMEIIRHLAHPDEVYALIKFKFGSYQNNSRQFDKDSLPANKRRCYELLDQTSRSFAAVIQELDEELRDAVCIFYLVLRALDTLEDDMNIADDTKIPMLKTFHTHLHDPDWCYLNSQEKDKDVLAEFNVISSEYRSLNRVFRDVIANICQRMGEGMASYINQSPISMADWDEYCHYVAGLVGIGLSRLFSASHLEEKIVGYDTRLANSMGLFLQKTNIIRDILEDVSDGRYFWPKETWSKYTMNLSDFTKLENRREAVHCLNDLVTNALQHIPDVIKYLSRLQNPSVFRFCAIPQVMAIATLERCYNNPSVFEKVVKIRKGETVKMIMDASSMDSVKAVFKHFLTNMQTRIPAKDPSRKKTKAAITLSLGLTRTSKEFVSTTAYFPLYVSFTMMISAILWQYYHGVYSIGGMFTDGNETLPS